VESVSLQAQTSNSAEIWLWQIGSWKAVGQLRCHTLTVTQMEFSHDDKYLLSVSRDRSFSISTIKSCKERCLLAVCADL
jgi:elongator complex protein 2